MRLPSLSSERSLSLHGLMVVLLNYYNHARVAYLNIYPANAKVVLARRSAIVTTCYVYVYIHICVSNFYLYIYK